jgi:hypothetical protein
MRFLIGAVAVVVAGAVAFALWPDARRGGVEVIGDHAAVGARALQVPPLEPGVAPSVTIVVVEEWFKMNYLGAEQVLCGGLCDGASEFVRVIEVLPGGSAKTVFVRIGNVPEGTDPMTQIGCYLEPLQAELSAVFGGADSVACLGAPVDVARRVVLPFGLGAI